MSSVMLTIEIEVEVFYLPDPADRHELIPTTALVQTVVPPAVEAWAKIHALDLFEDKVQRGELHAD